MEYHSCRSTTPLQDTLQANSSQNCQSIVPTPTLLLQQVNDQPPRQIHRYHVCGINDFLRYRNVDILGKDPEAKGTVSSGMRFTPVLRNSLSDFEPAHLAAVP